MFDCSFCWTFLIFYTIFFYKNERFAQRNKNKLCAWRQDMPRPSPVGAPAPRAPPSIRNVAAHAQYVITVTLHLSHALRPQWVKRPGDLLTFFDLKYSLSYSSSTRVTNYSVSAALVNTKQLPASRAGRIELFTATGSARQGVRRTAQRRSPKWTLLCERQFIDGRQTAKVKAVSWFLDGTLQLYTDTFLKSN